MSERLAVHEHDSSVQWSVERSAESSAAEWSARWAASGAAGLSGPADGDPLDVPIALVRAAHDAAAAITRHAAALGTPVRVDGPALLGERAALGGLTRRGTISCGGATRLLRASDAWIALSLARESDIDAVPAWLELPDRVVADDDGRWDVISRAVRRRSATELIERAVLLGMPIGRVGEAVADGSVVDPPQRWAQRIGSEPAPPVTSLDGLVVVTLASLWAGPLCAQLLGLTGMRIISVESEHRPDGARDANRAFFDLLHGGHESVCLDFRRAGDRRALAALLTQADVVIEGSRPRALAQLGIDAPLPGPRVWVSITGHGRTGGAANRVGFGDDAAAAGGLVTGPADAPCMCVDAVADPLTGLVAASVVLERLAGGDRWLLDLALARTAGWAAWGPQTDITASTHRIAPARARPVLRPAPVLGADTSAVLAEFGIRR